MKHIIALIPNNYFSDSTQVILRALENVNVKVTLISYFENNDYPIRSFISNFISIAEELDENVFFNQMDKINSEEPFDAIVNFVENYVEIAAKITERYGLLGNSLETAILTRDKYLMRNALKSSGLNTPEYYKVSTFNEFVKAINSIGFPCVSKPLAASASEGVIKIEDNKKLKEIYEITRERSLAKYQSNKTEILVESYIKGKEYSVEAIVCSGKVSVLGITAKTTEDEPFFNEIMHIHPALLPETTEKELNTIAQKTVQALGIITGGIHLEVRFSANGLFVIECASRLGGDAIPMLLNLAKGYDPYYLAIQCSLDIPISLKPTRAKYAGIRFIQPHQQGVVKEVYFDEEKIRNISGLINKRIIVQEGKFIGRPPIGKTNRLAFIVAVSRSYQEVERKLVDAEKCIHYTIE